MLSLLFSGTQSWQGIPVMICEYCFVRLPVIEEIVMICNLSACWYSKLLQGYTSVNRFGFCSRLLDEISDHLYSDIYFKI